MTATRLSTLHAVFADQAKVARSSDDDQRLEGFARTILAEATVNLGSEEERILEAGNQALILAKLMPPLRGEPVELPATSRTITNMIVRAFLRTDLDKASETFANVLRTGDGLPPLSGKELKEALDFGLSTYRGNMRRLLKFVAESSSALTLGSREVVKQVDQSLGSYLSHEQAVFRAVCLDRAGPNAADLQAAVAHHIEHAAQTLAIARKKIHFSEKRGGAFKPMAEEVKLLTATQVDCSWVTSSMRDLNDTREYATRWLDSAQQQVIEAVGETASRGFGVDLIVRIYPHVQDWFSRRNNLEPLDTVSRSV